jgi:hypothetical protein
VERGFSARAVFARGLSSELESEVRRALAIVKVRDGEHAKRIVEVEIAANGITVKGKFKGLTGVLGGTPLPTKPTETPPSVS